VAQAAERVAIWRAADWRTEEGPTHVSLRVEASHEAGVRARVREGLRGLTELEVDAFGPSHHS
jgi:hypothetical protein